MNDDPRDTGAVLHCFDHKIPLRILGLRGGYCSMCGFWPDMQSTYFDVPNDQVPGYGETFEGRVEEFRRAWRAAGQAIADAIQRAVDSVFRR